MNPAPSHDPDPDLQAILAKLGSEISKPLGLLQQGIGSLLTDPDHRPTDSEQSQAATMLVLCDEINRLTRQYLGTSSQGQD
jgi:hypothetical protein